VEPDKEISFERNTPTINLKVTQIGLVETGSYAARLSIYTHFYQEEWEYGTIQTANHLNAEASASTIDSRSIERSRGEISASA